MGKSAPKTPDPIIIDAGETAEEQAGYNRQAAIDQRAINMINQYSPYGSVEYRPTGVMYGGETAPSDTWFQTSQEGRNWGADGMEDINRILAAATTNDRTGDGFVGDFGSGGFADYANSGSWLAPASGSGSGEGYWQQDGRDEPRYWVSTGDGATSSGSQDYGTNIDLNRALSAVTSYQGDFGGGQFQDFLRSDEVDSMERRAAQEVMKQYGHAGWESVGDTGEMYSGTGDIPQYGMFQNMSPEQQDLYNKQIEAMGMYGDIGLSQLNALQGTLGTPFDLSSLQSSEVTPFSLDSLGYRYSPGDDYFGASQDGRNWGANEDFNRILAAASTNGRSQEGFTGDFGSGGWTDYAANYGVNGQNFGANEALNRQLAAATSYGGNFDGSDAFINFLASDEVDQYERRAARDLMQRAGTNQWHDIAATGDVYSGEGGMPTVNETTRNATRDAIIDRYGDQFDTNRAALETQLTNQGFQRGTEAFDEQMDQANRAQNDFYLGADLQSGQEMANMYGLEMDRRRQQISELSNQYSMSTDYRNRQIQEMLMQRNQPLTELSALLTGAQPNQQTFLPTPQQQVNPADYMGAAYANAGTQNQFAQNAYNQQIGANNASNQGLYGLVGTGVSAFGAMNPFGWSDRRLKKDIKEVGKLDNGLKVYSYNYIWGGPPQIGLMADEVKDVHPHAVMNLAGYDMVNYQEAVK